MQAATKGLLEKERATMATDCRGSTSEMLKDCPFWVQHVRVIFAKV